MQDWLQRWIFQYVDGDPANSSETIKARQTSRLVLLVVLVAPSASSQTGDLEDALARGQAAFQRGNRLLLHAYRERVADEPLNSGRPFAQDVQQEPQVHCFAGAAGADHGNKFRQGVASVHSLGQFTRYLACGAQSLAGGHAVSAANAGRRRAAAVGSCPALKLL